MYVSPLYANEPNAAEFEQFLADNCDWSADDFGDGYAWERPIPPRENWDEEASNLNAHLRTLENA